MSIIRLPGVDDQIGRMDPGDWPFLGDDSYIHIYPRYTRELAEKLANADADVAAAVNAAEAALGAAGDSGWVRITTWRNSFSAFSGSGWTGLAIRRRFGIAFVSGGFTRNTAWPVETVIANLPYRPTVQLRSGGFDVRTNGDLVALAGGQYATVCPLLTFPIN